jgi:ABC-2 type transport system permease protein
MRYLRIYRQFVSQSLKRNLEYRADMILGIVSFIAVQGVGLLSIRVLYNYIPDIAGWTYNELLLIYGIFQIPRGIDHLLTDNLWILSNMVRKGTFDQILTKPLNPLFHVVAQRFQTEALGELLLGTGILIYVFPLLDLQLNLAQFVVLGVFIFVGSLIYTAIKLFATTLSFWMKNSFPIMVTVYDMALFTQRPLAIYPLALRFILSYVIPFAFTAYFPALYLLTDVDVSQLMLQAVVVTSGLLLLSYRFWLLGIKHYESAGS